MKYQSEETAAFSLPVIFLKKNSTNSLMKAYAIMILNTLLSTGVLSFIVYPGIFLLMLIPLKIPLYVIIFISVACVKKKNVVDRR